MPRENRNNDISRFRAALQELENGSEEGVPMLNLTFTLDTPGFADGVYRVRAKGFLAAALWWAAAGKALADWSAFAYIPVAPSGDGVFPFRRRRRRPPGGRGPDPKNGAFFPMSSCEPRSWRDILSS